ncbi:MAG: prepilin peptidase [Lachnospiraceae bacterium]
METFLLYILVGLTGLVIGSFLNVCIYRIPEHEDIVLEPSHCMTCGYRLKWYDLIPVISYVALKGRCRKCNTHLSLQYPLVEAINGFLYILIFHTIGVSVTAVLTCLLASALLVLSVIDYRTYEIPVGINLFIGFLGAIHLLLNWKDWSTYVIGFFSVSVLLWLIFVISRARAIGGGDYKLVAAAGLFLGWQKMLLAFGIACIGGSVLHLLSMKFFGKGRELAMGPYLAAGVLVSALWGENMIQWYLSLLLGG